MDDLRIKGYNALLTPSYIKEEFPVASNYTETILAINMIISPKLPSQPSL